MSLTPEQVSLRQTGVGGSDAAAVLGVSRYKTPLFVWQEKRGVIMPQPDNESMLWGRALEPVIRQEFANRTGREVLVPADTLRHPRHAFMIANLDGVTEGRGLEIKTARTAEGWGEEGSDQIPQEYLLQCQHYMVVTALPVFDVAVLIGGADFRTYEVEADSELQEMLIAGEADFWHRVETGDQPAPVNAADIERLYRRSVGREVVATAEIAAKARRAREVKDQIKALTLELEGDRKESFGLRGEIETFLADADTLVDVDRTVLCTWRTSSPAITFDLKRFREAHPTMYSEYLAAGEPRRPLLIK